MKPAKCGAAAWIIVLVLCGGTAASTPSTETVSPAFHKILFVNSRLGWLGGYAGLRQTITGGRHWTDVTRRMPNPNPFPLSVMDFDFAEERTGWVLTTSDIFKTEDDGASWREVTPNPFIASTEDRGELRDIQFADMNHGWLLGIHLPFDDPVARQHNLKTHRVLLT